MLRKTVQSVSLRGWAENTKYQEARQGCSEWREETVLEKLPLAPWSRSNVVLCPREEGTDDSVPHAGSDRDWVLTPFLLNPTTQPWEGPAQELD